MQSSNSFSPVPAPEATSVVEAPTLPAVGAHMTLDGVRGEVYARAHLPTRHGPFALLVVHTNIDDKEHVALVRGAVTRTAQQGPVLVRLHSECLTGDVLASLRCDCRDQLEMAMAQLARAEASVLLYLRQEGRGIGLGNKVRAYALQEAGLDTVEANEHLGFDDDMRDYRVAAVMLQLLNVRSVALATNNPRKISALQNFGISVSSRVPLIAEQNPYNAAYLATKKVKAGHLLPER